MTTGRGARVAGVLLACWVLVIPIAATAAGAVAAAVPSGTKVVFHLQDPRIDEASGIGVGLRSKGIDYVENDSGDTHRFFALDAHTGATAAVITVPHATNVDWEDLQVAPDLGGRSSVWIADIGDNDAVRREVDVYRVPEPKISPDEHDAAVTSARPAIWRLRYPDGPTDAESLAVTPQGRAYVVTKSFLGVSGVYALPKRPDAHRVRLMSRVGTIDFAATPGRSPVGRAGSVLATSAAISRNGRLLAVRTYVYADVWRLHPRPGHDGVAAALRTKPTRVALPPQRQGEGIAFAAGRLLIDSEGVGTPAWSVALPRALRASALATAATSTGPPPSGSSTPSGSSPPSGATTTGPRTPATRGPVPRRYRGHFSVVSVLVVALLAGGAVLLGRRGRRRRLRELGRGRDRQRPDGRG